MRRCSPSLLSLCPAQGPSYSCTVGLLFGRLNTKGCRPFSAYTSPLRGFTSSSASLSTTYSIRNLSKAVSSWAIGDLTALSSAQNATKRFAHTTSNSKWLARQSSDRFTREAKVANLKSRAAFKLLQINERYRIFRPGMTVVDLGYAPGSWSQVAIDLVKPGLGRVVGVDLIPVQPPKGVNGMQGDFLSPEVQARVREFLQDENQGRLRRPMVQDDFDVVDDATAHTGEDQTSPNLQDVVSADQLSGKGSGAEHLCVDVVLSDMSEPWEITSGHFKNSISNPYRRMMNTTGNRFRDHAGSMDLCRAALYFSYETLKVGGSFVCKFYQGAEDKMLEKQLKGLFGKVHREKPESSRSESRESFFVCLKRLAKVDKEKVFNEA